MSATDDFQNLATGRRRASLPREIFDLLRENKKWWLGPIILAILLLAATAYLSTSAAAPFIYSLF